MPKLAVMDTCIAKLDVVLAKLVRDDLICMSMMLIESVAKAIFENERRH